MTLVKLGKYRGKPSWKVVAQDDLIRVVRAQDKRSCDICIGDYRVVVTDVVARELLHEITDALGIA